RFRRDPGPTSPSRTRGSPAPGAARTATGTTRARRPWRWGRRREASRPGPRRRTRRPRTRTPPRRARGRASSRSAGSGRAERAGDIPAGEVHRAGEAGDHRAADVDHDGGGNAEGAELPLELVAPIAPQPGGEAVVVDLVIDLGGVGRVEVHGDDLDPLGGGRVRERLEATEQLVAL